MTASALFQGSSFYFDQEYEDSLMTFDINGLIFKVRQTPFDQTVFETDFIKFD